ncbi:MAG: hypothetical protein Q8Q10_03615 [bacterium]|nr:hypothetical protein [bacterium]
MTTGLPNASSFHIYHTRENEVAKTLLSASWRMTDTEQKKTVPTLWNGMLTAMFDR